MTHSNESTIEIAKNYLADNIVINDAGCHIWQGSRTKGGYGQVCHSVYRAFTIKGAHRLALYFATGIMPESRATQVLHSCDVRACCNPAHLRWGTALENKHDMIAKGRAVNVVGEDHGRAILTEREVCAIRKLLATLNQYQIADAFGVAQRTISDIKRGKSWRHVN